MMQMIFQKLLVICVLLTALILTACIQGSASQNTNSSAGQTTGMTGQPAPPQTTQNDPNQNQPACTNNEDCALVIESCCPCSSGGNEIAIHQSLVANHNAEKQRRCGSFSGSCPTVYLCEQKRAECANSQCKAIDTSATFP